jgi:hypothetical protein
MIEGVIVSYRAANSGLIDPSSHSLQNLLPMSGEENLRDGIHNNTIHPSWWDQGHSERPRDWARRVCARRMADYLGMFSITTESNNFYLMFICFPDVILDTAGMRAHHRNGGWGGFLYTAIQQRIQLINWPAEVPFPNTRWQMNGLSSDMVTRLRVSMFNPKSDLRPAFQTWSEGLYLLQCVVAAILI